MFENLSNFDYRNALKNKKAVRMGVYVGGGIIVAVALYFVYNFFIFQPENEKSKDVYYSALNYAVADSTDKAIEDAQRGVKKYDGKIGGEISQFILARELMEKGEFKKALKQLEGTKLHDTFLSISVVSLKGDCYSEMKNYKEAKKYYMEASEMKENDKTTPENLFKAALVSEKLGQKKDAFDLYTRIDKEYPNFSQQKAISEYIARTQG